jgi:hypothetical protein
VTMKLTSGTSSAGAASRSCRWMTELLHAYAMHSIRFDRATYC